MGGRGRGGVGEWRGEKGGECEEEGFGTKEGIRREKKERTGER